MSCNNQEYFVGRGPVYLRRRGGDCAGPAEGWFPVGDASELSISISQTFEDHFESVSGVNARSARWLTQTTADYTMTVEDFNTSTLVALLQATDSGAVAGASVVGETVSDAYEGAVVYTAYPGISAVTVVESSTTLVEGTDYELVDNGRDGGIRIISGAPNISGPGPLTLTIDYTHVGVEAVISALQTVVEDFQIRFNGINLTNPNKPVIVEMKRAQVNAAENVSFIGDKTQLSFTGAVLADENGDFFTVTKANAVA